MTGNEKIEKEAEKGYEKPSFSEIREAEGEILEGKELGHEKKKLREELEKEIEKVQLSPQARVQAQKEAEEIKKQTVQGKIRHLLDLAQAQGLAYAVEVARKMNDPYLLDLFHDTLAKEGLFKKFLKRG